MVPPLGKPELIIVVILRFTGVGGLLAIPAIFFPYSWMNSCHQFAGLGTLPDAPIVSYLARSLSAFYAVVGTITFYISFDIRRYRSLVGLWAIIIGVMGLVLFGIDLASGLPMIWTLLEGPMTLAMGVLLLWAQRHIHQHDR